MTSLNAALCCAMSRVSPPSFPGMDPDLQSALGREAAGRARETLTLITQSKLALNGLFLATAGFFGIFGAVSLQLQQAIISVYVCIFGVILICFGAGWNTEWLQVYFGFAYQPGGHVILLLVAGNLAWSAGFLGVLAAVCVNLTAAQAFLATPEGAVVGKHVPLPDWMKTGPSPGRRGPSTQSMMTDFGVRRDELL